MRLINTLFIIIIALIGASFAMLNASTVMLNFYVGTVKMPLSLLLVLTFGFGMLLGIILFSLSYLRLKSENRRLLNRVKLVEKEVENLRAIPLKDSH